ncbi:MAG: hypothetical protein GY940_24320, partial [bacterium]|nr:hypothetical protein [bacterium]
MKTIKSRKEERKRVHPVAGMVLFLFFAGGLGVPLDAAIPAIEREALIALYNATEGDNWNNNSGWKDGTLEADGFGPIGSEGDWDRIKVSGDHVSVIELEDNRLIGSIPLELGNLSKLKSLYLYSNWLSGSIPSELSNLTGLQNLSLSRNQLSGSIPSGLGNLSNLQGLHLYDNQLSGNIPSELGNLANLTILNLSGNRLSGSIPSELGNLTSLQNLSLYENRLSGSIPLDLDGLIKLRYLFLYKNQLSGSIPSELGNLSNLEWLTLYDNQLSGSIPSELGNLSNLESLQLYENQLNGSIPSELGNLGKLKSLDLFRNRLSGSIPSSLTALTNCNSLYLASNALYTNNDQLRNFLNARDPDWEDSQTIAPANITATGTSVTSIKVTWTPIIYTGDTGSYRVYYSTTPGGPWTFAGSTADKTSSSYNVTGLHSGTRHYLKIRTQTDPHSFNVNTVLSNYSDAVSAVTGSSMQEKSPPFGSFDTPIDGLTARGGIPVTGWALDDSGIDTVKIYRESGNQLVYIGDGLFIEGARPDVAAAYPTYPVNTEAGWGYMLLTNFLPNSGNGTFVLHAFATDVKGKTTNLGTKTIHCDNANAVKPFGAIDTPTQGGNASGTGFVNFGWVLTPQPNTIPIDGSTITVWVDGVALGNPVYNKYRSDIAALFPN